MNYLRKYSQAFDRSSEVRKKRKKKRKEKKRKEKKRIFFFWEGEINLRMNILYIIMICDL
jgi:hypothetical protein